MAVLEVGDDSMNAQASMVDLEKGGYLLFEEAPEALFAVDHTGLLLHVSKEWLRLFGYEKDEVVGRLRMPELIEEGQKELCSMAMEKLKEHKEVPCAELKWKRKDGKTFWSRVRCMPLSAPGFQGVSAVGSLRDVSDERIMQERLLESSLLESAILECLGEGVFIMSPEFEILEVNRRYLEMTGLSQEEVVGKKCHVISHGLDAPCFEVDPEAHPCPVKMARERGGRATCVHEHPGKDGQIRYIECTAFPVRGADGGISVMVETMRDITDEMALQERVKRVERIEALGTLAGGVAHDLNNILTPIMGYVEMGLHEAKGGPMARYLKEIGSSAERAAKLVRQILAFARRSVLKVEDVDINRIIREMEDMLRRLVPENIRIEIIPQEDLWTVCADPLQVEQVVMNLVVNAKDAIGSKNGVITIETANVDAGEEGLVCRTCGEKIKGRHVRIMVSDNGVGMDANIIGRIFEPFFTTKEIGSGTGLGLSTVLGVMHQHQGHINIYSEPGKGSTFKVYFPERRCTAVHEGGDTVENEREGERRPLPSAKVLVADDSLDVRDVTSMMLKHLGIEPVAVEDGAKALEIFKKDPGGFDAVILDVVMPDMAGNEVSDELQKIRPDLPVIFMSGYSENAVHARFVLKPGMHYIQKPFTLKALTEKLEEVLGH